eukprot:7010747-Alexandrium_andersonii.AAC.1
MGRSEEGSGLGRRATVFIMSCHGHNLELSMLSYKRFRAPMALDGRLFKAPGSHQSRPRPVASGMELIALCRQE